MENKLDAQKPTLKTEVRKLTLKNETLRTLTSPMPFSDTFWRNVGVAKPPSAPGTYLA